jgi:hypothetical protein
LDWLDLLTPSAAILALFLVVGLVVQSVRQGRHIRQLEERVANGGGASTKASLERIAQLQARAKTSQGGVRSPTPVPRRAAIVVSALLVAALIGGGVWFLFFRSDGGTSTATNTPPPRARAGARALGPDRSDLVPARVPALAQKSLYTVAILNGTHVNGLAGDTSPLVSGAGYNVGKIGNLPAGSPLQRRSVVMYPKRKDRVVALNVAKDLQIPRAPPVDGIPAAVYGNADAVVVLGQDRARGP